MSSRLSVFFKWKTYIFFFYLRLKVRQNNMLKLLGYLKWYLMHKECKMPIYILDVTVKNIYYSKFPRNWSICNIRDDETKTIFSEHSIPELNMRCTDQKGRGKKKWMEQRSLKTCIKWLHRGQTSDFGPSEWLPHFRSFFFFKLSIQHLPSQDVGQYC